MSNANGRSGQKQPQMSPNNFTTYGNKPPQDIEAEKAVLGVLLLETNTVPEIMEMIRSEDVFYAPAHQKIFLAAKSLYFDGQPVDLVTVRAKLENQKKLDEVGGAYYLTTLTMDVVSGAHVVAHMKIVIEMWRRRCLIGTANVMLRNIYEGDLPTEKIMGDAFSEMGELSGTLNQKQVQSIESLQMQKLKEIDEAKRTGKEIMGGSTGFPELDVLINGLQPGKLIILAARPAVGKTAFTLQMARGLAADRKMNNVCVIYSLEMDGIELSGRNLASTSQISLSSINKPAMLSHDDIARMLRVTTTSERNKIFIDDSPITDYRQLRSRIFKMKQKHGVTHVFVDYLQLMNSEEKTGTREQEVSAISRELKALSRQLGVSVVALSQLNRNIETRTDPTPKISDLRESGSLEQDADIVALLYQATAELIQKGADRDARVLDIAKNRNGERDKIVLGWNGAHQTFYTKSQLELPMQNPTAGFPASYAVSSQDKKDLWEEETPF